MQWPDTALAFAGDALRSTRSAQTRTQNGARSQHSKRSALSKTTLEISARRHLAGADIFCRLVGYAHDSELGRVVQLGNESESFL